MKDKLNNVVIYHNLYIYMYIYIYIYIQIYYILESEDSYNDHLDVIESNYV